MAVDNSGNTVNIGSVNLVINPGSGPVQGASAEQAEENIRHFITDLATDDVKYVRLAQEDEDDGRFAFMLYHEERGRIHCHIVTMPGVPLDQVRFTGADGQDPWDFPRLYVDWSSWLWKYAVNCCPFGQDDDEDQHQPPGGNRPRG